MKTILNIFLLGFGFIFSAASFAHDSYLGHASDRGVIISVVPDKAAFKSGEKATFHGTIKLTNKKIDEEDNEHEDTDDKSSKKSKAGLLEEFRRQGIGIVASFPSAAIDISSALVLQSVNESEIKFTFESSIIQTSELNQFSLRVYNNHQEIELLKKLSKIKAKLDKRLLALNKLISEHRNKQSTQEIIDYIQKQTDKLAKINAKIAARLNSAEDLMAENTYAIQVDNLLAKNSRLSTVINRFRFLIESDPGTAIQGMNVKIKCKITNLRKGDDDYKDEQEDDRNNFKIADFIFNGQYLFTSPQQKLNVGESISFEYENAKHSPVNSNIFTIELFNTKKNRRNSRIGTLSQNINILPDTVAPKWAENSSPSLAHRYVKTMEQVNITVSDDFGRIDPTTLSSQISGAGYLKNVSQLLSVQKQGDGEAYKFTGDFNPLDEGDYTFQISVKDFGKNNATPSPYKADFTVDRTAPLIQSTFQNGLLTKLKSVIIPIAISDMSPTKTDVFANNELRFSSDLIQFSAIVDLNIEGKNVIKIVSTDAAGNSSEPVVLSIFKDSIPPVLSNLEPIDNTVVTKMRFRVAGISNEALSAATVNGMVLTLSDDKKSFSGIYISSLTGENQLSFVATDLVGNVSTTVTKVNLSSKLLVKDLVTIIPDVDNRHYFVVGKVGAAREAAQVSVSAGLLSLNRGSSVATAKGTFSIRLDKFANVIVKARDPDTGEEDSFSLDFNLPTQIAGVIKDTDGAPLPGATIRILGTDIAVISDSAGLFSIRNAPIGDQTLSVDGSTIAQASMGSQRKFSVHNMRISVSAGQVNTFPRPIYLTATLLDGSGTSVAINAAATVTDVNAPGVQISIPANGAIFPDGVRAGHISIKNIPFDKALIPVPANAIPDEIIAFEPSGLKFIKPVELVIPNVNGLKEGTELFLISLNSESGQWEIDGVGKVEPGGSTIKTKPGQGITHFSAMFAVPSIPLLESVIDPNLDGISTSKGAMEVSVALPSYKSLGQKITPSLKYNSSWAHPTAFASNIFDIPKYELTYRDTTINNVSKNISVPKSCPLDILNVSYCTNNYVLSVYNREDLIAESGYFVDELSAQSWVGINSTDNETFDTINNPVRANDLPGAILKNTIKTDKVTFLNNENGSAIPNMSQMSFGIPLKKDDGSFLKTGIYPSFTRFQAKLKHLTFTTIYSNQSVYINNQLVNDNQFTFSRKVTDLKTYFLDTILPKDLARDILVQNKVDSSVGRGWSFNSAQKIINTKGSKILIEEPSGEVSTYTASYPIETLFNANGTGVDLTKGAGLSAWPNLIATTYQTDKIGRAVKVDLSNGNQITNISQLETITGSTGFDKIDDCLSGSTNTIKKYKFNFRHKPGISNVVQFPDGRLIATNTNTHSVIDISNPLAYTLGGYRSGPSFGLNTGGAGHLQRYENLCQSLSLDCDPLLNLNTTQQCNEPLAAHDDAGFLARGLSILPFATGTNDFSNGKINGSGSFGTQNFTDVAFNSPTGMAVSPDGKLVVADTGSNVVYKINTTSGKLNIVAGDYSATDRGDGSFAAPQVIYDVVKNDSLKDILFNQIIPKANAVAGVPISFYSQSSIYHPKGLAYDSVGNLYITSENGYVRKVDVSGNISTYAGKKLEDGGVFASDIHAELMIFNNPTGIAIDSDRNMMYIADTGNHRVIQIDMQSKIANTVGGNNSCDADPKDGGSSLNASICAPTWLGFDFEKNLIVLDSGHQRIRRLILKKNAAPKLTYLPSNKDLSSLEKLPDGSFVRSFRDGMQSFFNTKGQQISSVDRVGRSISYTYDLDSGNLVKVSDATGQISEFVYSGDKLNYFIDPANRRTYFNYDSSNSKLLSSINFPDNTNRSFYYDQFGRMIRETNERGNSKQYTYNSVGRLSAILDENNISTLINDKISQTFNSPKREGLDAGKVHTAVVLPNSTEIKITNDANGFIRKMRDSLGRDTELVTDLEGKVLEIKRGTSEHISMKYAPITKDLIETKNEITGLKTTSVYNSFGQQISKTDFNNHTTSRVYTDTTGLLISEIQPNNVRVDYSYNFKGLPTIKTVYPNNSASSGLSTQFEYDGNGNITKIISSDGKYIIKTFDAAGNVLTNTEFKDAGTSFTTAYEYNKNNKLAKVTSPKGEVTQYNYLLTGELSSIIDPKEKKTNFEYDKKGQLIKKINPEGFAYTFEYDNMGNLIKEIDPNNSIKQFTYTLNNKIKSVTMPDDSISYEYDSKDQVSAVFSNLNDYVTYTRDLNDRVIIETAGGGSITNAMTYDDNGNRTTSYVSASGFQAAISFPGTTSFLQKVDYSYDANNRLTSLSNMWGDQFNFNYDQANRLTSMTRPGSKTDYVYDSGSNLAQIIHSANNITKSFTEFTYDNRNFITQKRQPSSTFNYTYDNNGQLIESLKAEDIGAKENFSYDALGNRTNNNSTYDQSGQRIQDDGQYTYVYDNNGNILSKSSKAQGMSYGFEYNSRNQMKKAYVLSSPLSPPVKTITYTYDPIGRRTQRSVVDNIDNSMSYTRKYIYDGSNIVAEIDGNNRLLASYTHSPLTPDDLLGTHITSHAVSNLNGGDAISEQYVLSQLPGNFYYLKDHLNTVTDIINAQGNIIQRYDYSSFGVLRGIKDNSGSDIGISAAPIRTHFSYTSRERESETGLYYYRARYYDPSTGRFLQQDPDPGKLGDPRTFLSKYIYTGNMPTMFTDSSGRDFWGDIGTIAGIAVAAVLIIAALPGATFAGAISAVAATLAGSTTAGIAMALVSSTITGDWAHFWSNAASFTKVNFAISSAWLVGSAVASATWGGGITGVGANGTYQGYVSSKNSMGLSGGMTIGSSSVFSGTVPAGGLGLHELGHTMQFIGLSRFIGFAGQNANSALVWGSYLGFGILGLTPAGSFWEDNATNGGF